MEEEIIFRVEVPGSEKAINSIENLTKANKALREERKKLDLDSEQGQRRVKEINETLDKNTNAIVTNTSAIEKQRANIGNYKSALDGLAPGLSGFISGVQGMTKASLAFIATPIGAIIAAVGVALASLTAYFRGSEEGQNRLNKIMLVGKSIFEQFQNVLEFVGKTLFEAFSNPKQAIIDFANLVKENVINRFEGFLELIPQLGKAIGLLFKGEFVEAGKVAFDAVAKVTTGIENASGKIQGLIEDTIKMVEAGVSAGQRLADLQAKIDKDERALITERARVSLEVSKLRAKAIQEEGDVKKKTVEEAIALEEKLSDKEVALAKLRLANAKLLLETNGDDKEALNAVAKAQADLLAAEESRFSATLRFQKELEKLRDEERKEQERIEKEQAETNAKFVEEKKKQQEQELADAEKAQDQYNKNFVKNQKKEADAVKKTSEEKEKALDNLSKVFKEHTIAGKSLAVGQATINTYQGATEILKQKSTLPSPFDFITKAINFAATIAAGLGAVQAITGVGFAKGGFLGGMITGNSHAHGGVPFSVGGRLGFEAEGGEAIINKRSTQMFRNQLSAMNQAGGGVPFAVGGITGDIARLSEASVSQNDIFNAIAQLRPIVTVEDINLGQQRVQVLEDSAQVIS